MILSSSRLHCQLLRVGRERCTRSYVSFNIVDLCKGLFYDLHYRYRRPANVMSVMTDLSEVPGASPAGVRAQPTPTLP